MCIYIYICIWIHFIPALPSYSVLPELHQYPRPPYSYWISLLMPTGFGTLVMLIPDVNDVRAWLFRMDLMLFASVFPLGLMPLPCMPIGFDAVAVLIPIGFGVLAVHPYWI